MICIRLIPVLLLFLLENQLTAAGSEDKNRKKDSGERERETNFFIPTDSSRKSPRHRC